MTATEQTSELAGRYRFRTELGRGASGRVVLADDLHGDTPCAIKLVLPADAERLRWERSLLDRVAHPALARVYELISLAEPLGPPWSLSRGATALVQEYVEGLHAGVAIEGVASGERPRFVTILGARVARALGAMHSAGLVHGDVKPENIVVGPRPEQAKLVDLGLARPAGYVEGLSGTLGFLAPEALLGERSSRTDLYALGVTLHTLLLGRSAFDTVRSDLDLARVIRDRPRPQELPTTIPLPLRRVIGDLLAQRADERPAAAREVALRLDAIAEELGAPPSEDAVVHAEALPHERAASARVRPLIGRNAPLSALQDALRSSGVIAVVGPRGAGRSRLVFEAVKEIQARAAVSAGAPTFVRTQASRPPPVSHAAIVHLDGPDVDVAACVDAVAASEVAGHALRVVIEAEERPEGIDAIELEPLDEGDLRTLLAELLEIDPSRPLVAAARQASGGLPGRLCRLVADAYEQGLSPLRPQTLSQLGGDERDGAVPKQGRALAEVLAVVGGTLTAAAAEALIEDVGPQASALTAAGMASWGSSGELCLRVDVARALYDEVGGQERLRIATKLANVDLDGAPRAYVNAALGDWDGAASALASAIAVHRAAGDPEGAAELGRAARRLLPRVPWELADARADALRALAREGEALDVIRDHDAPQSALVRAELLRLSGDPTAAEACLDGRSDAMAVALRARLALDAGALPQARALARGAGAAGPEARARLLEVLAFVALMEGDLDEAANAAGEALAAAQETAIASLEARACSVQGTVHQARGRVDEAAALFERASELADAAGERLASATYLVNVGLGRLERGIAGGAIEALREGARRLVELGRRESAARVLYNLGNAAALIGDDDLARQAIERALRDAQADPVTRAYAGLVSADLSVRAGKLELAARALLDVWARHDVGDATRVLVGSRLAVVCALRGKSEDSQQMLTAVVGLHADPFSEVMRAIAQARVSLAMEQLEAAADQAASALALAATLGWECRLRAALLAAEVFERTGRPTDAQAAASKARELLDVAAGSLSPDARARLRAVPAYQRVLTALPASPVGGARTSQRQRDFVRHARILARESRLGRLPELIVDAAIDLAHAERGFFVQRDPDGSLSVRAARALGASLEDVEPSRSVVSRTFATGRPMVTVDALEDARLHGAASIHAMSLRSVLAVPLSMRGGPDRAIVLDDRLRPGAFGEDVVQVVTDLADLAAGALERAEALRGQRREARRLARDKRRLVERVESAEQELRGLRSHTSPKALSGIVAHSGAMRAVLHLVDRVASADAPVLVLGESGTGKELIARAIRDASARSGAPYVSENCSAIPESLLESTLFGHVRGAFTGADRARRGLFEIADGGTLFLDEIGEMSPSMQAKLLRVLQDGELRPIGSERTHNVNVRLVAATHRDLEAMVAAGTFRRDLFYRIAVVRVELPPLRDRPEDIAPLVAAFLERHAHGRGLRVHPDAMSALRAHRWPGNVRELENEIRRALVVADHTIRVEHLSPAVYAPPEDPQQGPLDLKGQVDALERRLIRAAMDQNDGNRTQAARVLGVSRYGLQKMMKRLGIDD